MMFVGLGLLVAALAILDRAAQIRQWSSLFDRAGQVGAFQNEIIFREFDRLPTTPFAIPIIAIGLIMSALAMWHLFRRARP